MSATPCQILIFVAGTAAVALWLIGCACFAHCRGDDAMGVADTQGREPEPPMEGDAEAPRRLPRHVPDGLNP